ncbi:unknown [Firmicutes bacterium CAG:884]|nr:CotD family spore coat protein [Bacillota bacterium]CCY94135.1 unknown [Firmicutes bacterium CAG:884]
MLFGFGRRNNGCGCGCNQNMDPCRQNEVIEPTITKCVEKEFYHEVPHICPIHTHVVNKHIYNHTYRPEYTCSEENVVVNNDCNKCSGF